MFAILSKDNLIISSSFISSLDVNNVAIYKAYFLTIIIFKTLSFLLNNRNNLRLSQHYARFIKKEYRF